MLHKVITVLTVIRFITCLYTYMCFTINAFYSNLTQMYWVKYTAAVCPPFGVANSVTYLLTYSMVQSPSWEANWFAASQEIPRISRNPKVHYCTHKRPPLVSILGPPNPVHIHTTHLLEIHLNIIHPSKPRSPQWSLFFPFGFPTKTLYTPLSSPIRATCPAHLILLDFITRTILGEEYKSFSSSLCSLLHSPVTSSLLGPNILLNTIFSNTLSFLSSHNVNDHVSHPYKKQAIFLFILVVYTFIQFIYLFMYLYAKVCG